MLYFPYKPSFSRIPLWCKVISATIALSTTLHLDFATKYLIIKIKIPHINPKRNGSALKMLITINSDMKNNSNVNVK